MLLKKTKLAGIISLLFCSNAMAVDISDPPIAVLEDSSRFGPFVSAMDTSSAAVATTNVATYTNTYAQSFTYDIGAPWTYNEYCVYDSDVCEMFWDGSKTDGSDGLYIWRRNILNTYGGSYVSDSTTSIINAAAADPVELTQSRKITAMDADVPVGYGTTNAQFVRRGFYGDDSLTPLFKDNGGFSSAHDATQVLVESTDVSLAGVEFNKKLIVGQSSVDWPNANGSSGRFNACFNAGPDDDRFDYDDLYYCPGFNLQASYWTADDTVTAKIFTTKWINGLSGSESDATYIANAYAINTSGFAVGFSTQNIFSGDSGGRARATIFVPKVTGDVATPTLSYSMSEILKPKTDTGSDYNDIIRDTVAIDITDNTYNAGVFTKLVTNVDTPEQAFIVVGNRTYNQPQNRSYATEFYTYDVKTGETRYPFQANPIKGANSQVSKINNDGLVIGWRDARGQTSPTAEGSARFQSAFIYDYKNKKSAYLDDLYCNDIEDSEVKYRFTNAISITDNNNSDSYTIVANGFDYKNVENYKNRVGSTPVVLSMTVTKAELDAFDNSSQCPIKANEDYERSGGGMGWFVLLPTMMLLFRRFKR
ncbi:DUF3466 family protein [Moritella sp. Urea-trap-13]|uniref:DUF3466 family protein n=1 Tax=Moritella sp. Urea-trap-13 TaxID=2058327 RepID=UPI000C322AB6|nr:DUF3466 family protein [Moritella sp. Urea-trap-13]PKH06436.1 hypothetical protein CXF93_11005 [Moritella sp. Urea-trap-13]